MSEKSFTPKSIQLKENNNVQKRTHKQQANKSTPYDEQKTTKEPVRL